MRFDTFESAVSTRPSYTMLEVYLRSVSKFNLAQPAYEGHPVRIWKSLSCAFGRTVGLGSLVQQTRLRVQVLIDFLDRSRDWGVLSTAYASLANGCTK